MPCHRVLTGVICTTPEYRIMDRGGKVWRFEFNKFTGPALLHKQTGEPRKTMPPGNSPFWDALTGWINQGQQVEEGVRGTVWAKWDPKKTPKKEPIK